MAENYFIIEDITLTEMADEIRGITGQTEKMTPELMTKAIKGIPTGPSPTITEITQNCLIAPDADDTDGYYQLSQGPEKPYAVARVDFNAPKGLHDLRIQYKYHKVELLDTSCSSFSISNLNTELENDKIALDDTYREAAKHDTQVVENWDDYDIVIHKGTWLFHNITEGEQHFYIMLDNTEIGGSDESWAKFKIELIKIADLEQLDISKVQQEVKSTNISDTGDISITTFTQVANPGLVLDGGYTSEELTVDVPVYTGKTEVTPGAFARSFNTAGKFVKTNLLVSGNANLVSDNIKAGTIIFGVTGNYVAPFEKEVRIRVRISGDYSIEDFLDWSHFCIAYTTFEEIDETSFTSPHMTYRKLPLSRDSTGFNYTTPQDDNQGNHCFDIKLNNVVNGLIMLYMEQPYIGSHYTFANADLDYLYQTIVPLGEAHWLFDARTVNTQSSGFDFHIQIQLDRHELEI